MKPQLTKLVLRDFQAHEKLVMVFDSITTICGSTDKGKSAILRALRWLCLNQGKAEGFIRMGEDGVKVKLMVDGKFIRRERVKSSNEYSIDDSTFKAFGMGVPPEVEQLLRVNEVNFQGQHDPVFWFSQSGGEVSRQLNSVVDLEIIDASLASIASDVRSAQERVSIFSESVETLTEELKAPERKQVVEFDELFKKRQLVAHKKEEVKELFDLLTSMESLNVSSLRECVEEGEQLLDRARRARSMKRDFDRCGGLVSDWDVMGTKLAPPDFSEIENQFERTQKNKLFAYNLECQVERWETSQSKVIRAKVDLDEAELTWKKSTKNQVCPLCQNPI